MIYSANRNLDATARFVASAAAAGLSDVVICPGSRSTPLTLAFHAHPHIQTHLHLDERSGAFFALGLALATDRPVAIVCTSGTAAANFYPAVIEANMSQVPLLILTADRPPELRHSGANQTIDQVKMYGDHVLWAVDMDVPTDQTPGAALRNLETTATRAMAIANGQRKGAVHINWPFRKPFEGSVTFDTVIPHSAQIRPILMPGRDQIEQLARFIDQNERGLIVCGPRTPGGEFPAAVTRLARMAGYPIVADPLSGMRFASGLSKSGVIGSYETAFAQDRDPEWAPPTLVIRFGAVPTSKWLNRYLGRIEPAVRLHVRENGVWADDSHQTTDFWGVNEAALCQLTQSLIAADRSESAWYTQVRDTEAAFWEAQSIAFESTPPFDARYLTTLFDTLPPDAAVVVGNSLPIRHIDQFIAPRPTGWTLFSNRGASGIDGVVSTAVGVAMSDPDRPTVLIIGDVSFFHDLNGLFLAKGCKNLTIVVLNNNGGSIFRRLPIAAQDPPFTPLFLTPHDLDFEPIVRMHRLEFRRITAAEGDQWSTSVRQALESDRPSVLEVMTNGAEDAAARQALLAEILGSLT